MIGYIKSSSGQKAKGTLLLRNQDHDRVPAIIPFLELPVG